MLSQPPWPLACGPDQVGTHCRCVEAHPFSGSHHLAVHRHRGIDRDRGRTRGRALARPPARHHAIVRKELKRFHGHEVDTAGDGFFATFGAPADGVRCAGAIADAVHSIGLEIRAGLHTGETELTGEKAAGIAVTTAARVSALAGPGEVLVTRTLAELVAGSGFGFSDRGEHELKGVPGEWRLLALSGIDGEPLAPNLHPEEAVERRAGIAPVRHGRSRGAASSWSPPWR